MRKLRGCIQVRSLLKALDARRSDADNGAVLRAA
jgi:putative transposase